LAQGKQADKQKACKCYNLEPLYLEWQVPNLKAWRELEWKT